MNTRGYWAWSSERIYPNREEEQYWGPIPFARILPDAIYFNVKFTDEMLKDAEKNIRIKNFIGIEKWLE